jgi:hypothetical protein
MKRIWNERETMRQARIGRDMKATGREIDELTACSPTFT